MLGLTPLMWIVNIIVAAIQDAALCRILTRRWSWWITVAGLVVGFLLFSIPPQFMPRADMARQLYALLVFPLPALILFRDKWYRSLFCSIMTMVIMVVSDLFTSVLFFTADQLSSGVAAQPVIQQLLAYMLYLPLNAILLWVFTLLMNRFKNRLSASEWVLYLAFPFSQFMLLYGWILICRADFDMNRIVFMLTGLVICVAADGAMFIAIRGMAQRSELKAKNDLLARQIDLQKEHYAAITAQYENIRHIRHDIASHLYTMEVLLKEGAYSEASAYFAEVSAACRYRSHLGSCENPVVDAFLYFRRQDLCQRGYDVQIQAVIPAELAIHNSDLVIAFGNLLDNAAEACGGMEKPVIRITAAMQKGFLNICVENTLPAQASSKEKKRRIPQLERGIGSHICQELAEKYQGSFACSAGENSFTATLILKGGLVDASDRNM